MKLYCKNVDDLVVVYTHKYAKFTYNLLSETKVNQNQFS